MQVGAPIRESAGEMTAAANPAAVTVERASVAFRQGTRIVEVLRDVSFEVGHGEIVALIGPSGCGKSTLLHVISGLSTAGSGMIRVYGKLVTRPGDRDIAYMFQGDVLLPWKTVRSNIALPLLIASRGTGKDEVVDRYVELVGLGGFGDAYPGQLSGGMRQRAQLARTLIQEPRLLLMDEPFGALDAQTRAQLQEDFLLIVQDRQVSVLCVTHDVQEAILMADRILVLTNRPAQLAAEIVVPFARPRQLRELVKHREFNAIFAAVLSALERPTDRTSTGATQS